MAVASETNDNTLLCFIERLKTLVRCFQNQFDE